MPPPAAAGCDDWQQQQYQLHARRRYGPSSFDDEEDQEDGAASAATEKLTLESDQQQQQRLLREEQEFRKLADDVLKVQNPQHIPSLLTKRIELILSLLEKQYDGTTSIQSILLQDYYKDAQVSDAVDLILTFAQDFVEQTERLQKEHQELLGKILRIVSDTKTKTSRQREEELDALLQEEDTLTAGFVRHLDSECDRIASAPQMTRDSTRLLELIRTLQTRVLEEMAETSSNLGPAAQVLGQLMGYDSEEERLAVLEAGLNVRGPEFAQEMKHLTEEALDGFRQRHGDVDPDLMAGVQQIDDRLQLYLQDNDAEESITRFQ